MGIIFWTGIFLVERKSIPDFCLSIKDGRLFTQAGKLVNSRIPACIVLEGKNREFRKTDFSPKAIQGILLSISMAFRLPILRTKNTHESVEVMLQGFKQLTRDKLEEQRFYPRTFHSKPKKRSSFGSKASHS
ncbi:ERCC4 domain-containing protein [Algoriphagus boritolerans]|uniref:ERCC4 domain-containing protein n=1 Tax=Algoriphagus boritolerans TaxID=308111 RepID=UPI002FCDF2C0